MSQPLAVFVVSAVIAAQPGIVRSQPSPNDELIRLESVWNQAHANGDADALDELWVDDIVIIVPGMAVMSKKESLAFLRSGRMKFDVYATSDLRTRAYESAAVVTGRVHRARRMGDRSVEDHWFFTKVYARVDGRWRVVSWHASDVPR